MQTLHCCRVGVVFKSTLRLLKLVLLIIDLLKLSNLNNILRVLVETRLKGSFLIDKSRFQFSYRPLQYAQAIQLTHPCLKQNYKLFKTVNSKHVPTMKCQHVKTEHKQRNPGAGVLVYCSSEISRRISKKWRLKWANLRGIELDRHSGDLGLNL